MKRREFLEATAASLLLAGCGGGGSNPPLSATASLRIGTGAVYASDQDGNRYRASVSAHTVARLDANGTPVWTVGRRGTGPLQFDHPADLAVDRLGRVLVVDRGNARVQILDAATGQYRGAFGKSGSGSGQFRLARFIAVARDRIYVSNQFNFRVEVFDLDGRPLSPIGRQGNAPGEFDLPRGVAVDRWGDLYVADGRRIQRFAPDGHFEARADGGNVANPRGIAIDADDELWVADGAARRVRVLTLQGGLVQSLPTRLATGAPAAPHAVAPVGADVFVNALADGPVA
ncbi:MAG: NHL repeat-containing protein [Burkholderiales bacterium]